MKVQAGEVWGWWAGLESLRKLGGCEATACSRGGELQRQQTAVTPISIRWASGFFFLSQRRLNRLEKDPRYY